MDDLTAEMLSNRTGWEHRLVDEGNTDIYVAEIGNWVSQPFKKFVYIGIGREGGILPINGEHTSWCVYDTNKKKWVCDIGDGFILIWTDKEINHD